MQLKKKLPFGKGFRIALGNRQSQAGEMVIEPGGKEGGPRNRHRGADQWLFVVSGKGSALVNGKRHRLQAGSLVLIEHGDEHEIENSDEKQPLRTLNFYVPPAYTKEGEELPRGRA
jgi:mannose-6-phosphate isomerase-like protein (cupin superfamily)